MSNSFRSNQFAMRLSTRTGTAKASGSSRWNYQFSEARDVERIRKERSVMPIGRDEEWQVPDACWRGDWSAEGQAGRPGSMARILPRLELGSPPFGCCSGFRNSGAQER